MKTGAQTRDFIGDDRGVIMILGAVGGAFLIGAVWFIWGVGQAAVFRENMQSAADATAYQVSVYDARGMNLIAMINLIMSVVLTILVVMRVVQAIIVATNIVSCIFGAIFDPVCDITTVAEPEIAESVDTVAQVVNKVLTGLSLAESGISIVWPYYATASSVAVSTSYGPAVKTTVGLGESNVPAQALVDLTGQVAGSAVDLGNIGAGKDKPVVSVSNIKKAFNPGTNGLFCNYGGKFFLPTQSDGYSNLCARAGANVAYAFEGLIDLVVPIPGVKGPVDSFFNDNVAPIMGSLIGQYGDFFCKDDASALMSVVNRLLTASGEDADATKALDKKCDAKAAKAQPQSGGSPSGTNGTAAKKDVNAATKQCKDTLKRAKGAGSKAAGNSAFGWGETCPKKLYDGATMLDHNFQNWGLSFGSYADASGAIVGTANGKEYAAAAAPSKGADMQVAQSEFYYEPKSADETSDAEKASISNSIDGAVKDGLSSGLDNVMWNMRWRARLRRVRAPSVSIGAGLASLVSTIGGKVGGTAKDDNVKQLISQATTFLSGEAGKVPGQIVIGGEVVSPEMVH